VRREWPARRAIRGRHEPRGAHGCGCLRRFHRPDVSGPSLGRRDPSRRHRSAERHPGACGPCTAGARRRAFTTHLADALVAREIRPIAPAGTLLGAGLGGLLQAIVITGMLGRHHVLAGPPPAVRVADAMLLAVVWLATVAGVGLAYRAARRRDVPWSGRILSGTMLFGWGAFNLLEGAIAHQILGIHHVVAGVTAGAWDLAFLALATTIAAVGWSLTRGPVRRVTPQIVAIVPREARRA